ncbi:hypothetical protein P691DRAFT_818036 [Macrolepiota fuliginosa MF-IS2]|uniref:DUF6533 domain-containing protein n=1 Tax=Macrolepiota fuliginosa MF-IS2 TaxID=1400762 RepID=A0A9P6BVG4_9AGAR|nr:hypothetical protein P691DRAFT_818036 [Macrolepiota fuliginosa MF-IS2]
MAIPNFSIALYSFFLYKYFHLLPNEIEDIWLSKWGGSRWVVNSIYIICRYTTFVDLLVMIYGIFFLKLSFGKTLVTDPIVWESFVLAWELLGLGLLAAGITLNVLIVGNATVPPAFPGNSFIPNCSLTEPGEARLSMWGIVTMLISDSILMVVAIGAKFKFGYSLDSTNSLTRRVYHDAVYYFVLNFLISLTSILLYDKCPGPLKMLTGTFCGVATRCLSCRIVLRLKGYNRPDAGFMTTKETRNSIQFCRNPSLLDGEGIFRRGVTPVREGQVSSV